MPNWVLAELALTRSDAKPCIACAVLRSDPDGGYAVSQFGKPVAEQQGYFFSKNNASQRCLEGRPRFGFRSAMQPRRTNLRPIPNARRDYHSTGRPIRGFDALYLGSAYRGFRPGLYSAVAPQLQTCRSRKALRTLTRSASLGVGLVCPRLRFGLVCLTALALPVSELSSTSLESMTDACR
jgi:hypothetical protein